MLFQPTNITPDVINGIGNGTIDLTDGLAVSWQVNGNSPLLAYRLFIYRNDSASTQLYATSKITLASPFYGIDYQGNIQMFAATTIPYSTLSENGITNGNEYKLMIRQYYSTNGYIDQRSMSVFVARNSPTVSIATSTGTTNLSTRQVTFNGTYTQANGDVLNWIQWDFYAMIPDENDDTYTNHLLESTGKIYNTGELKFEYDGMTNNSQYSVTLTIETENGVRESASLTVSTEWTVGELPVSTAVTRVNTQSTAMRLNWYGYTLIQGEVVSGNPYTKNGNLYLNVGDAVLWDDESGTPLSIDTNWLLVMYTHLQKQDATLLKITTEDGGVLTVNYSLSQRQLMFHTSNNYQGGEEAFWLSLDPVAYDASVAVMISHDQVYLRWEQTSGALVPSNSLYPYNSLPPNESFATVVYTTKIEFTDLGLTDVQSNLVSVDVGGAQNLEYIQVFGNETEATTEGEIWTYLQKRDSSDEFYYPDRYDFDGSVFLADFENGLDAGTLSVGGDKILGWAVYRRKETEATSIHLIDVEASRQEILDYGCGSAEGMYHYEIYPIGETKYLTDVVTTRSFNPVFENWSVIEATYNASGGYYSVLNEYIFGKNLSSGSVSNNNSPYVAQNFTRYPTVMLATSNYQSGTLSSLIGHIGYFSYVVQSGDTLENIALRFDTTVDTIINANENLQNGNLLTAGMVIKVLYQDVAGTYFDDKKLRDAIWELSTSTNTLFLKSRKGDVMEIRPSGAIDMSIEDGTMIQAVTASFPWVQIGDATHEKIIGGDV